MWSFANKLCGLYMLDKYSNVIISMAIIRQVARNLEFTKRAILKLMVLGAHIASE